MQGWVYVNEDLNAFDLLAGDQGLGGQSMLISELFFVTKANVLSC